MQTNYIDMLMNDHGLIEKGLLYLSKEAEKGNELNLTLVQSIMEFLWDYGDQCHNMKEETVYFPLLLERGMPPQGPISIMLVEHKQEKEYIDKINKMISLKAAGENLHADFKQTVDAYCELTKGHIWKENDILYPMGKKVLNDSDAANLQSEFLRIENSTIGEGGYLRYHTFIQSIEKRNGGRVNLLASLDYNIISNMLDSLPIELSLVDVDDRVRYFNKLDEKKIFARTLSVVGRTVQQCHPQKSVHLVNQILEEMKAGTREKASFWLPFEGMFVHISYFAVRDDNGVYQGCVEMVQDIKPYRELDGDKRLLDES